jgi:hypothetical protein
VGLADRVTDAVVQPQRRIWDPLGRLTKDRLRDEEVAVPATTSVGALISGSASVASGARSASSVAM